MFKLPDNYVLVLSVYVCHTIIITTAAFITNLVIIQASLTTAEVLFFSEFTDYILHSVMLLSEAITVMSPFLFDGTLLCYCLRPSLLCHHSYLMALFMKSCKFNVILMSFMMTSSYTAVNLSLSTEEQIK